MRTAFDKTSKQSKITQAYLIAQEVSFGYTIWLLILETHVDNVAITTI